MDERWLRSEVLDAETAATGRVLSSAGADVAAQCESATGLEATPRPGLGVVEVLEEHPEQFRSLDSLELDAGLGPIAGAGPERTTRSPPGFRRGKPLGVATVANLPFPATAE
jgi:hypothetical protein